jgi:hypothetical protein
MICYKLVRASGNSLFARGVLSRRYKKDGKITAHTKALEKGFGLLCFETISAVHDFNPGWRRDRWKLLRVSIKKEDLMPLPPYRISPDLNCILQRILDLFGKGIGGIIGWPLGTIMCKKLQVLKEEK